MITHSMRQQITLYMSVYAEKAEVAEKKEAHVFNCTQRR